MGYGLILVQKAFSIGLFFGGAYFFRGAYYWREFCVLKWAGLDNKNSCNSNFPWAYIWEGLLSEGYLCLKFGGLIFGRAYFGEGLLSEFYGSSLTESGDCILHCVCKSVIQFFWYTCTLSVVMPSHTLEMSSLCFKLLIVYNSFGLILLILVSESN